MFESAPDVTVVVPTYNRADLLTLTVQGFQDQVGVMSYEVIWVDDGSTDRTGELLRAAAASNPDRFRYIALGRSGSPSLPRNTGIQAARSEIVITLDDDIVPDPDFVLRHWQFHLEHKAENAGAVGELYLGKEDLQHPMAIFSSFPYHELAGERPLDFLHFWAGNMSVKRSFMLRHGMYRVDKELPLLEDMECGYRMMEHGFCLQFLPAARGRHFVHKLTPRAVAEKGYYTGRSQRRLLQLVPDTSIMRRFGVLSLKLGHAAFLARLLRRVLFLLVDNRATAFLLILLGARSERRSAISDFYYRLIFRRNMLAGYRDALKKAPLRAERLVVESRL